MKSIVTLYYKCLITKDKNFILDNADGTSKVEEYLSTLTKSVITDFQYVKNQLSLSIKINSSQTNLQMIDTKNLNYVKVVNYTEAVGGDIPERPIYYFVINKIWKSQETIELVLSMDTLNTFSFNTDYKLSEKTLVRRQHKDRFFYKEYESEMESNEITCYGSGAGFSSGDQTIAFEDLTKEDIIALNNGEYDIAPTQMYDSDRSLEIPMDWIDDIQYGLSWDEEGDSPNLYCYIDATFKPDYPDITGDEVYFIFYITINSKKLIRKVDLKSEDISAPVYKKTEEVIYEQDGDFSNSWVLYYKNQDNQDDSPIDCYLTSDLEFTFLTETGNNEITLSDIDNNKILFLCDFYQGIVSFDIDGEAFAVYHETNPWPVYYSDYVCLGFENRNGVLVVHQYIYRSGLPFTQRYHREIINPTSIIITTPLESLKVRQVDQVETSYSATDSNFPFFSDKFNKTLTLQPLVTRDLASSNTIDKTLAENVKIINIPYCPSQIEKQSNKYIIGGEWTYDTTYKFFKLEDFSAKFENNINSNVDDAIKCLEEEATPNITDTRNVLDSKLFHSDYYRYKFVYDSFSRIFPLEQIDYIESYKINSSGKLKFTFVMSRNIVSKFLFKFNYIYNQSTEDYPNIVAVARNNEEVLYNSQYLNYVRTGYNYDLKSKERQEATGLAGIGLSFAGLLASIGLSFTPYGALGVAGAIGSGIGLANQFINYAKTTAQNEENIQRKLQEAQRQSVSVLNADDYDLLYAYTQNKAKLCLYEVSDQMKGILDDLFYYCGYVCNEQMIPVVNTRYWFNFVQAGIIINENSNLPLDIEDDIKNKFEEGATFLHYHSDSAKKFDFKQEMENWEISLLD